MLSHRLSYLTGAERRHEPLTEDAWKDRVSFERARNIAIGADGYSTYDTPEYFLPHSRRLSGDRPLLCIRHSRIRCEQVIRETRTRALLYIRHSRRLSGDDRYFAHDTPGFASTSNPRNTRTRALLYVRYSRITLCTTFPDIIYRISRRVLANKSHET